MWQTEGKPLKKKDRDTKNQHLLKWINMTQNVRYCIFLFTFLNKSLFITKYNYNNYCNVKKEKTKTSRGLRNARGCGTNGIEREKRKKINII